MSKTALRVRDIGRALFSVGGRDLMRDVYLEAGRPAGVSACWGWHRRLVLVTTPKQLAYECGIQIKYMRMLLRDVGFKRRTGAHWRFDDKEAQEIRKWLKQKLNSPRRRLS